MKPATHLPPLQLPARYSDAHGEEESFFHWENGLLQIVLRDIAFWGTDFSNLHAKADRPNFDKVLEFANSTGGQRWGWSGPLTDCTFEVKFPIGLWQGHSLSSKTLVATIKLAQRRQHGLDLNLYQVQLSMFLEGHPYSTPSACSSFEGGLAALQLQLPPGHFLRCCLSCKWSHYAIYGNAPFGALQCFRKVNPKPVFRDKDDLINLDAVMVDLLEFVPETAACAEHEPMLADDWGYKTWPPERM